MNDADDSSSSHLAAATSARLFPLPDLVLFPHVVQPLHIFEPRYCALLEDSLAGDKLIAMVMLQPGWEADYEGRPAIAPVACLGKIVAHERLPTGRHNILLRGLWRAAIRREVVSDLPFRQAEVDLLDDFYPTKMQSVRDDLRERLVGLVTKLLPGIEQSHDDLLAHLHGDMKLGMLTDILSFTLPLASASKQRLLAEWNVARRANLLAEKLAALIDSRAAGNISALSEAENYFRLN